MKQTSQSNNSALVADNSQASTFSMADLMAQFEMPSALTRNAIVTGEVVASVKGGYLVSLGGKSDSLVRDAEAGELVVGQSYKFFVMDESEADGEAVLSYRQAAKWEKFAKLQADGTIVMAQVHRDPRRAVVRSRAKDAVGGLIAYIDETRCFIPRSETQQHGRLEDLAGKEIPVVILNADSNKGRGGEVIISQTRALAKQRDERLSELKKDEILPGTVVKVIDAGVLVDVGGGLTGLVYRTEVSGDRNADPAKLFRAGDEVTVKVVAINLTKGQVSLSIRAARQGDFLRSIKEGDVLTGTVARFESYGAFVSIGNCIDGLLHIEDYGSSNGRREKLTAGQSIEVQVNSIDLERGRISLSRKALAN
jgi:small subunit ribosomal protein S1